ncbi:hypothetical protein SD70_18775 [Gordoniibacillus kamchatkensis]|uniref:Integrase n=1 Tax=Gordoniibacillus kamchatkensis TaxID=1590651 RepID=A0ABR5AF97_9BACL|nr:hypothetical protein [Paenibacillus sp. VKM B-2647]KIL39677.1 hypothetical protein SD70_18775 [Paenibacillus sp. VKM B-2647]
MSQRDPFNSRKILKRLTDSFALQATEQVVYHSGLVLEYQDFFDQLVYKGTIKGVFKDNIWTLIIDNQGHEASYNFNVEIYGEINKALKCYVLLKLSNGLKPVSTQTSLNYLQEAIHKTSGFMQGKSEVLAEHMDSLGYRKRAKMAYAILEFLQFYPIDQEEDYVDIAAQFAINKSRVRDLPRTHDVFIFDQMLLEYFETCNEKERLKYSMLLIWWKLTKIIPMRPIEFYKLSWDCNKQVEQTYWITLPREKQQARHNDEVEVTNTLQINKELFELISEYKRLTQPYIVNNPLNRLLSYDVYRLFFDNGNGMVKKSLAIDSSIFHNVLKTFYLEVIEGKYGYLVEDRITAGDTRHFAFCNMMLQGFNMLSIARIGGHKNLRVQMHYHAHLEHFAESAVYILARGYRTRRKMFSMNTFATKAEIKSKIYSLDDYKQLYEVEHGYCTDHPLNCKVGDCRFCEHYYFHPTNKVEGLKWLRDCSDALKSRINEQIEFMISISKNMDYSLKTLDFPYHQQEKLASDANELKRFMDQKAMVDAILLGEYENDID